MSKLTPKQTALQAVLDDPARRPGLFKNEPVLAALQADPETQEMIEAAILENDETDDSKVNVLAELESLEASEPAKPQAVTRIFKLASNAPDSARHKVCKGKARKGVCSLPVAVETKTGTEVSNRFFLSYQQYAKIYRAIEAGEAYTPGS